MGNDAQERVGLCREIKTAFEQAGVGVIVENYPQVPYAVVTAYINPGSGWHSLGPGWQRRAFVFFRDDCDDADVFISGLYRVPDGKVGRDMAIGGQPTPLLKVSRQAVDWSETIVARVRAASQASNDTVEATVIQPPPPPVALEDFSTLGDLIDAYEKHYPTVQYHDWLKEILSKLGKVHHRSEEWFVDFTGHLCHTETSPDSAPVTGPDGETVIYTNAAYIRLDAYRDLIEQPS
jgi:hypothetical protein